MVPRIPSSRQISLLPMLNSLGPGEIVLMSKGQRATSFSHETAHVAGVAPGDLRQKTPTTNEVKILGGLGFDLGVVDEKHAPFDRRHDRQSAPRRARPIARSLSGLQKRLCALLRLHVAIGP